MKRVEQYDENCFLLYKEYQEKVYSKKNVERFDYLKTSLFDYFIKLKQFINENLLSSSEYMDTMLILKIKPKEWTTQQSLNRYLIYRSNMETPMQGILRTEKFLKERDIDIYKLDLVRLSELIKDGWLSKHYFHYLGLDLKKILPAAYLKEVQDFV